MKLIPIILIVCLASCSKQYDFKQPEDRLGGYLIKGSESEIGNRLIFWYTPAGTITRDTVLTILNR